MSTGLRPKAESRHTSAIAVASHPHFWLHLRHAPWLTSWPALHTKRSGWAGWGTPQARPLRSATTPGSELLTHIEPGCRCPWVVPVVGEWQQLTPGSSY